MSAVVHVKFNLLNIMVRFWKEVYKKWQQPSRTKPMSDEAELSLLFNVKIPASINNPTSKYTAVGFIPTGDPILKYEETKFCFFHPKHSSHSGSSTLVGNYSNSSVFLAQRQRRRTRQPPAAVKLATASDHAYGRQSAARDCCNGTCDVTQEIW